ncbi:MAG TPA: DUF481 domain-containing protein [Planctomycetota bacterium]|nr:DUF481 domain-containing protein [Planctomycetota bacterium]
MSRAPSALLLPALLSLAALAVLSAGTSAQDVFQEGTTITVELMNGDKLTGILLDAQGPQLVIQHDVFGRMEIPRAAIKPPTPPEPEPVGVVEPWTGKFDLALVGSGGNTETQLFRTSLDAKHEYEEAVDVYTLYYTRTEDDGEATAEKAFGQARHEWRLEDSKWRPFVQGSWEADKFTDYDARGAVAAGVAYPCVEGESHTLTSRLGGGVNHKYGTDDPDVDQSTYELLIGADWLWKISELDSFSLIADVYPAVDQTGEYRSISRLAFERKLDKDSTWFIKLGLDTFYDSQDGDETSSTDNTYYVGLGTTF